MAGKELTRPMVFQDVYWAESVKAIKDSLAFSDFAAFSEYIEDTLPQNSAETRRRYRIQILNWFFPDGNLSQITADVWRAYQNDVLLEAVMRYQYLSREPGVAAFVTDYWLPLEPGAVLPPAYIKDYALRTYGQAHPKVLKRLPVALCKLGFAVRQQGGLTVLEPNTPPTALLILLHYLFVPEPSTILMSDVLAHPFWKYLGFRYSDAVRAIMRQASTAGFIAKYVVADQLEQVTTRYSYREFIERRSCL